MSTYYVAGIPYSDELYHFGIKGQKWGIRRYQNEDGTLTPAGKERYGDNFGSENSHNILRRLATGDHPLGIQRHRDKREQRLLKKAERQEAAGEDSSRTRSKYEAQKKKNIDIDNYVSNTSTAKLLVQNYIMTFTADSYRASRARGESRGRAFVESIMPRINLNPLNTESFIAKKRDKEKYGDLAHKVV